ncbi:MAG: helix-turn-helix domain-containing protein [Pseudonocardiaceae bacterium]
MAAVQDPTVQRRRLRMELRRARDAAGLKQAEVARAMDWSPSKLIRIEKGDVGVSTNDLKALLSHYGVKDKGRVNGLLELARAARGGSFYDPYADLLKQGFKDYLAYEASASVIRQYDPVLIPGLLQTEEYGRAILEHTFGFGADAVDRVWTVRQHRQELHDREDPPDMLFVVDEAALRRDVGRGHVMTRQLERLKEFAAEPHISLQVLPFTSGAHPGMAGNFVLLEFADPTLDDLVHLESIDEITIRDDTLLIARYTDRFLKLEELALPPDESNVLLDTLISEMSPADSTASAAKEAS